MTWRMPPGTEPAVRRITVEILGTILGRASAGSAAGIPCLHAGGDLHGDVSAGDLVWGSGLAGPAGPVPRLRPSQVIAVRGMLTADRMVENGIRLRDIPIGDPGLLAARVLRSEEVTDASPVVVVPSADGRGEPFFARFVGSREVCVADLGRDSLDPLREIAGASVVIAQDLNGLVWAEAFGKPSVWVASRSDDRHDFRFRDWFSTVFERQERPMVLGGKLEAMVSEARRAGYARSVEGLGSCLAATLTDAARAG